jgi:hypothetical protein
VLGLETRQLNRAFDYGCTTLNQLEALDGLGLLDPPLDGPATALPAFPHPLDPSMPLEDRARAFLHANCAHCHMPGGATGTGLDLRATTALAATGMVAVPAQKGSTGADLLVVHPAKPAESELMLRLDAPAPLRMPPLATSLSAPEAAVVQAWIAGMPPALPCPPIPPDGGLDGFGAPYAQGQAGVLYRSAMSAEALYFSWTGTNLQPDDIYVAIRQEGAPTATTTVGGAAFAGGGWSWIVSVRGPNQVCLFSPSAPSTPNCGAPSAWPHYAGWPQKTVTTVHIPTSALVGFTPGAPVSVVSWATNNTNTTVWSTGPASNPTGSAPRTMSQWATLPQALCAP